ncbi:TPA: hypothetical protein ACSTL1_003436 [Serratia fonticola]
MEDAFKIWEKVKDIQLDLLLFVLVLFFAFKFKDITELFIRLSSLKTERLQSAKEMLELSDNGKTTEMKMIKELMRSHAVRVATNLISDKGRKLYCYLFVKFGLNELAGAHKLVHFVSIKDNGFFFDKSAINSKRWRVSTLMMLLVLTFIYMSIVYTSSEGVNLSWLFRFVIVIMIGSYFYWWAKIMPDDIEVKNIERLLQEASVSEYHQFLKGKYPPIDETTDNNS